nr:transposase, MuDR [Ipomoea batatas]
MRPRLSYKNGIVEYFDHFNCDEGSILDLRRMVKQLRFCDKKVQFWYQYGNTRKPKVMKLSSDADILGLITDIPKNKELDIYVEHHYDDQWDYEVEIDRELGDDTLMYDEIESEDDISGSVGEEFVEVEGVDVRDTATSSHGQGLDGLGEQNEEFAEVEENHEAVGQFKDVVVETQVPDFVLNEMEEMSSQPSQSTGGANAIRTVSDFIAAKKPTSTTKKYITVGGIRYSYSEAYLIRK